MSTGNLITNPRFNQQTKSQKQAVYCAEEEEVKNENMRESVNVLCHFCFLSYLYKYKLNFQRKH